MPGRSTRRHSQKCCRRPSRHSRKDASSVEPAFYAPLLPHRAQGTLRGVRLECRRAGAVPVARRRRHARVDGRPTRRTARRRSYSRLTAKAAAWLTMPFTPYRACATLGPPGGAPLQIVSPAAHRSMVLAAYNGPMTTGGAPTSRMNWSDGLPNRVTAATWSATSGGIGAGTSAAGTPSGTTAEVTNPATTAPCENPPSTILVLGQFAAVVWTWAAASLIPSITVPANWIPD